MKTKSFLSPSGASGRRRFRTTCQGKKLDLGDFKCEFSVTFAANIGDDFATDGHEPVARGRTY
jgi:hypothetical protein